MIESDGRYTIWQLRGEPGEDEGLVLRLVVAIGVLSKLALDAGRDLDKEYIEKQRRFQLRRHFLYWALAEVTRVAEVIRYYAGDDETYNEPYNWSPYLPELESDAVTAAIQHLGGDGPHVCSNREYLGAYLAALEPLQRLTHSFNVAYQAHIEAGAGAGETWTAYREARSQMRGRISKMPELDSAEEYASGAYMRLNADVDRWDW